MGGNTALQVFLILQVLALAALAALAVRHAYRGRRREITQPEAAGPAPPAPEINLPPALKDRLLQEAQAQFESAVHGSAAQLQQDLKFSSDQINKLLLRLATDVVSGELERYHQELAELHKQAQTDIGGIKTELVAHKAELESKMAEEVQAEKLRLIRQINTKLADAVGSFLTETLQHNVDLGAQSDYLIAMLEEHKADFRKEVTDEAKPAE